MAEMCVQVVQACAMRLAKLEPNGVPDPGAGNILVNDFFTQLVVTAEVEEGDEFITKNACGGLCVNFKDCDRLKRLTLTLGLCKVSPYIQEFLAGGNTFTAGDAVGYAFPEIGAATCPNGVSVELWAKRLTDSGGPDPDFPYEWVVIPRAYFQHDARTFENGPVLISFNGFALENENWFDGPTNDYPNTTYSHRAFHSVPTTTIPTVDCEPQTLVAS